MDRPERSQGRRARERRKLDEVISKVSQAVDQSISRIKDCHEGMLDSRASGLTKDFREEQMKACSEINQLKSLMSQLDVINQQIPPEDVDFFDRKLKAIRDRVNREISLFQSNLRSEPLIPIQADEASHQTSVSRGNLQLQDDVTSAKILLKSFTDLQRDLTDLNDIINRLSSSVVQQRETVDRIEENISDAKTNVVKGAITLSKIKKGVALPLIGAAIGAAVAGPLGMVAGYKAAAVASIGTATIGYWSGKAAQKVTSQPEINLSIEGNSSTPDDDKDKK